ncbi:MAG TPA: pyridoxamine 5'-phosphate oxidase family protein [Rhodopila sp.]|uniref:pyridoxamine 5'-phosphate oxidase family protein n=1 Tax=Rhodopila sp. TaxID=2480087 RepID=UPI002B93F95F|nr:pyridoxamine 5'-phosphate oxidase family protein [Rhodopila sp.]HVY17389.1 pyridoxamine 5'-phosphate oxidase family protein [Rhodopila sp.]
MQVSSDIAFTDTVKQVQARKGSRAMFERRGGFRTTLTPELVAFLGAVDTAYLATASAEGQPYAQHRGGPKGFIRHLGGQTLAFADYAGNRQYVTTGNLAENDRAFLFLMDYAHQQRVKLWGRARVVEDDPDLLVRLMPEGYKARPEQVIVFEVEAWDINCRQHIPQKFDAADVAATLSGLQARIEALESENAALRARLSLSTPSPQGAEP